MTILIVHAFYRYYGGEDKYVESLADLLRAHSHQVILYTVAAADWDKRPFFAKFFLPLRMFFAPKATKKLKRVIAEFKPDIASIHNLLPFFPLSLLKVLRSQRIPIVKKIDNYRFLCLNGLFLCNGYKLCDVCKQGNFIPGILHRCYQHSLIKSLMLSIPVWFHRRFQTLERCVDRFYCPSQFSKSQFVAAGFASEKFSVLRNIIAFAPLAAPQQPAGYAVFVGRLAVEKGVKTLLLAAELTPQIRYKIAGEGPLKNELQALKNKRRLMNVDFVGHLAGALLRDLVAHAMFTIFPSECHETFGTVIMESFSCGVPVVAARIGAVGELVEHGVNGLLCAPGDAIALSQAIRSLVEDPQSLQRMRCSALAAFTAVGNMESAYQERIAMYHDVIENYKG